MPPSLDDLFQAFRDGHGDRAWPDLLDHYGGLLLQCARSVFDDEDDAGDAFVFVCERLAENGYARLRRFDPAGPARSTTWLRAVARNLCIDRHRARHGRVRVFESIAKLPVLDQLVFRRRVRDGLTLQQTLDALRPEVPHLTLEAVAAADDRVSLALGPRQLVALSTARPKVESLDAGEPDRSGPIDPASPDPSPEALLGDLQTRSQLRAALGRLPAEDRLLVRLRIEQSLTLAEVARVAGLRDPQQADRRLRSIYQRLRTELEHR